MSSLRELKYNLDKISESSGHVYWQNSSQPLNAVYFQSAPGVKHIVWQDSISLTLPPWPYSTTDWVSPGTFDVGAFIEANNPNNAKRITVTNPQGQIFGPLSFNHMSSFYNDAEITFENFGEIQGTAGNFGLNGGAAIALYREVKIINNGWIRGGGGSGGRGGDGADTTYTVPAVPQVEGGIGGLGGYGAGFLKPYYNDGGSGAEGTWNSNTSEKSGKGGNGGHGGDWGDYGYPGSFGSYTSKNSQKNINAGLNQGRSAPGAAIFKVLNYGIISPGSVLGNYNGTV